MITSHTNLNKKTTPLQPSDFDQPTAVIRLTGSNIESILDKPFQLYERARAAWRGTPKGKIAKTTLALVSVDGIVRETYAIAGWFRDEQIMRVDGRNNVGNRIAFVGNLAPNSVRAKFNGRSIKELIQRAAVAPVVTFGFNKH